MTEKFVTIITSTPELVAASSALHSTPEFLAWFDALTDEDIAGQIASDPDSLWELDGPEWEGIVPNPNPPAPPAHRPELLAAYEAAHAAAPRHLEPAAADETAQMLVRAAE